jgi:hypothetical protein
MIALLRSILCYETLDRLAQVLSRGFAPFHLDPSPISVFSDTHSRFLFISVPTPCRNYLCADIGLARKSFRV